MNARPRGGATLWTRVTLWSALASFSALVGLLALARRMGGLPRAEGSDRPRVRRGEPGRTPALPQPEGRT